MGKRRGTRPNTGGGTLPPGRGRSVSRTGLLLAAALGLAGCAGPNKVGGDPLLGNASPTRTAPPPPAKQTAQVPPVATPTSSGSNAALASGTPALWDGGSDLRIRDQSAAPTASIPSWNGQAPAGNNPVLQQPQPLAPTTPTTPPLGQPTAQPLGQPAGVSTTSFNPSAGPGVLSYEQAQSFLTSRGVTWQRLETDATQGDWKFSCSVPNRQNRFVSRTYEARDRDYLSAMRAVIDQIDKDR